MPEIEDYKYCSEYANLTAKYRCPLSLTPNQVVAKTWVSSVASRKNEELERGRFRILEESELRALQRIVPFNPEEIESMSFDRLCNLYVAKEMVGSDIASEIFEYVHLRIEVESITTFRVDLPGVENPPAYATVVTFLPNSKVLRKIQTFGVIK